MNNVNQTLYIPLYGKAQVSKKGIILQDCKAEEIWEQENFPLRGKAKSKWLAYFMAMRARVFDEWVCKQLTAEEEVIVLHIGCGMDSRYCRINRRVKCWYDIDFPEVIAERKKYFKENGGYVMLAADAAAPQWVQALKDGEKAIVILEGVGMYLRLEEVQKLFQALAEKYHNVNLLMDVYTTFGAKASKYKNPIHEVGVTVLYGMDDPLAAICETHIHFTEEHTMTPKHLVAQLKGFEHFFFQHMFAGGMTRKIYRLFEYEARI